MSHPGLGPAPIRIVKERGGAGGAGAARRTGLLRSPEERPAGATGAGAAERGPTGMPEGTWRGRRAGYNGRTGESPSPRVPIAQVALREPFMTDEAGFVDELVRRATAGEEAAMAE